MTRRHTETLSALESLEQYRVLFKDLALWEPHVRAVCARHGLPCNTVREALPGTYPTFVADDRWVVKFFGRLFDGAQAHQVESEVARLLARDPAIPAPPLLASGQLRDEETHTWPWPYLIFGYIPGVSVGEVRERLPFAARMAIAREAAGHLRRLHALPVGDTPLFPASWEPYAALLARQYVGCAERHRAWGTLPPRLAGEIPSYVLPPQALLDRATAPHLIHADLTADHLLGWLHDGRWTTTGLIDFGDAMIGDLAYELVALHLDLFRCDRRLLAEFLEAYGEPAGPEFARRMLSVTLLHLLDVLRVVFERVPELRSAATLAELAETLWGPA